MVGNWFLKVIDCEGVMSKVDQFSTHFFLSLSSKICFFVLKCTFFLWFKVLDRDNQTAGTFLLQFVQYCAYNSRQFCYPINPFPQLSESKTPQTSYFRQPRHIPLSSSYMPISTTKIKPTYPVYKLVRKSIELEVSLLLLGCGLLCSNI